MTKKEMTRKEIAAFIRRHPACTIATCEGDQPRARIIMTYRADADGIVFMTGSGKDFNHQLLANPKAELCYYDPEKVRTLRITGRVEVLPDEDLKEKIIEAFSFLKPIAQEHGLGAFTVWCLAAGSAVVWDAKEPFEPKVSRDF